MRAMSIKNNKALTLKSMVTCTDNSGAKEVYIISVFKHHTIKRGNPKAGIGSMVNVVIKKGKPEMRGKIEKAVVVRTKQEYKRINGMRVKFEDNAVVLVDAEGLPKASEIKGCVAKEVGERYPKIAGRASTVV
jgi:large subunit ribosomal protein L14